MRTADHDDPLYAWLRLMHTEGIGSESGRRLLCAFGSPQAIFQASSSQLCEIVAARQAQALMMPSRSLQKHIALALEWALQPGQRIMTLADADYPQALLNIADPPLLLYLKGRSRLLSAPALAVVGSRNASTQGLLNAERLAQAVSRAGICIVSGLALGIDAAAHEGGLRGAGSSIAVLGTGIDITYPQHNSALAQRLSQTGCLVSEYGLGMPPMAAHFPRRNRIISGLARAVLVVEAAAQSGSLITARMAAEQGRDVLAIPGSIHAPLSKGCHSLIKQGAKLVESVEDILCELGELPLSDGISTTSPPDLVDDALLHIIGFDPVDMDTLSCRSGIDAAALPGRLLLLELEGLIEALPGRRYRRLH